MTEDQLEQEALSWLVELGYAHLYGPDISPDGENPERATYQQVLMLDRFRTAVDLLNPGIPLPARADAVQQVVDLGIPVLLAANRHLHKFLVGGVPVQYQREGETIGDYVRLIDWATPGNNEWLAINQFSIKIGRHRLNPRQQ